ncbi:MAG TPA: CGNR zinc finger domain-containing protein [Streptosporangiaceae bacterium]|jgi:predicted RNA-binding Zn ribbon-like protein
MTDRANEDFRWDGGRRSLDLIATIGNRPTSAPVERLPTPRRLAQWLRDAGLTGRDAATTAAVTDADLAHFVGLREALYRLVRAARAGGAPEASDVALVNDAAAVQVRPPQMRAAARALVRAAPPADGPRDALALVARDAIELLTGDDAAHIGVCAADDCELFFVDPSGRRRFCSAAACGTRTRVAAHRARRRTDHPDAAT